MVDLLKAKVENLVYLYFVLRCQKHRNQLLHIGLVTKVYNKHGGWREFRKV